MNKAEVCLYWKDDPDKRERYYTFLLEKFNLAKHHAIDDEIFYYCEDGVAELEDMKLRGDNTLNDFVVVDYDVLILSEGEDMGSPWIDPMGDEWEEEDEDDFEDDPEELP